MRNKVCSMREVRKEISSTKEFISFLKRDFKRQNERLNNLNILFDYMFMNDITLIDKEILLSDDNLEHYVLPVKISKYIDILDRKIFALSEEIQSLKTKKLKKKGKK